MSQFFGPLNAITGSNIGPMRYTESGPPRFGGIPYDAMEIFSLKVTELKEVAVRDSLDHKRNVLFDRSKENCQTLTAEDSSLALTGPSRAIALIDPLEFEVELRVLGSRPSEETVLSALYFEYSNNSYNYSKSGLVRTQKRSSKRSTIELKYSQLHDPLEATIEVRHKGLCDFHGRFYAHVEYMGEDDIVLLDSRDLKVNFTPDGRVLLSRNVVLIEEGAKLILGVKAWQNGDVHSAVEDKAEFPARLHGRGDASFDVGFCKMSITVAWSVLC
ncbi:hypothetical protein EJB05_17257 [Eragrostis curvula]|uniref:DUF6598 domain-containing protein n=1 Tax=Eragrostis curvula TaxID=38414 RepID=A0A5J9VJY5_9POAL|nr:hypothetical protein EJB05_17257 [Eragrostis curvula]